MDVIPDNICDQKREISVVRTEQNVICRSGRFEAAHRVLFERFACFNLHGHQYRYELVLSWSNAGSLGYALDFKEIKRIFGGWVDLSLDHSFIANPKDIKFIMLCREMGLRVYPMRLLDPEGFCNPTAENIAKELYFSASVLLWGESLKVKSLRLWETENCYAECFELQEGEREILSKSTLNSELQAFKLKMGFEEYDERLAKKE